MTARRTAGRIALLLLAGLAAAALWAALVFTSEIEGWGRTALAPRGDTSAFLDAAAAKLRGQTRGAFVLELLDHGKPAGVRIWSSGAPVTTATAFQVASLSKWITSFGVMKLAEQHKIDLDAPVSRYVTRWHLPESGFDNNGVTIRRLLSHTAGLTDGLGYGGFLPGQAVQTPEQSLTHASDPMGGADGRVRVGRVPGSAFQYSGGGFMLLQLLIEEVSHRPFNDYMRAEVLAPLGMTHSTYVLDAGAPDAISYETDGRKAPPRRYTALAAASLYTTADDLTAFIQAQLAGGRGVVTPATLALMRKPQARQYGIGIWGLGTILYASNDAGGHIVGHDGNNAPAINTAARFDPASGNGIVVLESGNSTAASEVASEWVFWDTGNVDIVTIGTGLPATLLTAGIGGAILFLLVLALGLRRAIAKPGRTDHHSPNAIR
jgi:CubicO group peptidase (beta-lactamase class C family)